MGNTRQLNVCYRRIQQHVSSVDVQSTSYERWQFAWNLQRLQ